MEFYIAPIMWMIFKLTFLVTIFDIAKSSTFFEFFDVRVSHTVVNTDSVIYNEKRSVTLCGVKCMLDTQCVAFDICETNDSTRCAIIQNPTSFISSITLNTTGECMFYAQRGHPLFTCNYQGTWSSQTGRCECQPNICGDMCENICTTVTTEEETTVNDACPTSLGFTFVAQPLMCYKVNRTRVHWSIAKATCETVGAMLLMLHTEDRWTYWNNIAPSFDDEKLGFWIGGNDIAVEGRWVWSDGSLFTDHTFMKWGRMYIGRWIIQPDNNGGIDNCLRLNKFVHPDYLAYPETEYTWHDDWCEISTLSFIYDQQLGFWIGGNDIAVEGRWVWSDGSLFADHAFVKWGRMYHGSWKYEPDNGGGKDNCLRFFKYVHPDYPDYPETEYTWHDDWCETSTLFFICEISMN